MISEGGHKPAFCSYWMGMNDHSATGFCCWDHLCLQVHAGEGGQWLMGTCPLQLGGRAEKMG